MSVHRLLTALACALMLSTLPAIARSETESTIVRIEKRGTMMVGMSTFVPWAMRDKQGKLIGFEIDVATKLAHDLGVKLDLVPTAWDGIIPALLAGKFDMIIGGMTITTQRNLTVNFSSPYEYSGTSLAVSDSIQKGFTLNALNSPHVTIDCRRGSTACIDAGQYFPKARLRQFDNEAAMTQDVLNGNATAFAAAEPLPSRTIAENPGKLFAPLTLAQALNPLPAGIAIRKGDVDTLNVLDNWIAENTKFLETRYHYWFQTQDWQNLVGK